MERLSYPFPEARGILIVKLTLKVQLSLVSLYITLAHNFETLFGSVTNATCRRKQLPLVHAVEIVFEDFALCNFNFHKKKN